MPFNLNDLKPSQPNSPARWASRRAWLARKGLTPADLESQQEHQNRNKEDVAEAMKVLCRNFSKALRGKR